MVQPRRHLWHVLDTSLTAGDADELDLHAARNWDKFYQQNKTNFFKDRHYLGREFPELSAGIHTILEVGCGVGNTAYPLLDLNKHSKVYACDFAPSAVKLVKAHPEYSCGRMHAFLADITCDDLTAEVPAEAVDICTMVFVLSAITPAKMPQAIVNVATALKPGSGRVLVRDYAEGDLAQLRLAGPTRHQRISDNFFARSDGTQAYYFTQEMLLSLFKAAGFTCNDYKVHERQIENKQQQVVMHRRWVQAIFTYKPQAVDSPQTAIPLPAVAPQAGGGPPLQAQEPAQPTAAIAKNEEDRHLDASTAAAPLADHHPSAQKSSNTGQCTSGGQTPPSDQQAAATDLQPAWQQQPAASQPQQPWGSDAALPASASRVPQDGCVAQPVGKQQGAQNQQGSASVSAVFSTNDASALGLEAQQGGGVAVAACSEAQRQEWEEGGISPEQEPITGCLFADSTLEEVEEDVEVEKGVLVGRVVSVSRQHRDTLEHTGLMRWESSLPLARFLLALPSLTQGRQVLEVGSGVNPLCCLAALKHCRRYVATDGSLEALQGLARNLDLNCRKVVMERARVSLLAWNIDQHQSAVTARYGLFDVIIGADVLYAPEALHSLFQTCSAMLKSAPHATLVLCYVVRRVTETSITAVAAEFGLTLQEREQEAMYAASRAMAVGLFRLLVFCRK